MTRDFDLQEELASLATYTEGNGRSPQRTRRTTVNRKGRLLFTYTVLKNLLEIPDDCEILGTISNYTVGGVMELCVEFPNCPKTLEGSELPVVTKAMLTGYDE